MFDNFQNKSGIQYFGTFRRNIIYNDIDIRNNEKNNTFNLCHSKNEKIIVINYKIKIKYIYQKHITKIIIKKITKT